MDRFSAQLRWDTSHSTVASKTVSIWGVPERQG